MPRTHGTAQQCLETFVGPASHALPPDNFQEDPKPVVAQRTSPTNIGLYLLATVTARDLGWLSTGDALDRFEATLGTMSGLERFRELLMSLRKDEKAPGATGY